MDLLMILGDVIELKKLPCKGAGGSMGALLRRALKRLFLKTRYLFWKYIWSLTEVMGSSTKDSQFLCFYLHEYVKAM